MPQRSARWQPAGIARPRRGLRLALNVWWHGTDLDRRLAAGEDQWASDALALRARLITRPRARTRVADGLAGVLRSARDGSAGFTAAVAPRSADVLEASAVIAAIEDRLRAGEPVAARGVAILRLLLIDGNGPLYCPGEPGALSSRLRTAAAALRAREAFNRVMA